MTIVIVASGVRTTQCMSADPEPPHFIHRTINLPGVSCQDLCATKGIQKTARFQNPVEIFKLYEISVFSQKYASIPSLSARSLFAEGIRIGAKIRG
jgi:hypothetical protein